jgi:drug/metabolite transporter (DMT)-like permease
VTFTGSGLSLDTGGLMIAGACLCWGIDNTITRGLAAVDPIAVTAIKAGAAGILNLAAAVVLGAGWPDPPHAGAAAVLGLGGIGFSLVLYLYGMRRLGAARTAAYYSIAPFVGAVAALAIFQQPPTFQLLAAAALMGVGVWLHVTEEHAHVHLHEPLEHEHLHVHDIHHQHEHAGPVTEPHSHPHRHAPMRHSHAHYPDLHHRHGH